MVKHYSLTLDGTAQRLSQVYASGAANAQPSAAEDIPYRQVFLQADPANANAVFIGATSAVNVTCGRACTLVSARPTGAHPMTGALAVSTAMEIAAALVLVM